MNSSTNIILIFIFLFINLNILYPSIDILTSKSYLFFITFIFQVLLTSVYNIKKEEKIILKNIFLNSLKIALLTLCGFSIGLDIINNMNIFLNVENNYLKSLFLSGVISIFILVIKSVESILDNYQV